MGEFNGLPSRSNDVDRRPRLVRYAEQQLTKGCELRIDHAVKHAIWRKKNRTAGYYSGYADAVRLLEYVRIYAGSMIVRDDAAAAVIRSGVDGRVDLGGHDLPAAEPVPARLGPSPRRQAPAAALKTEIVDRRVLYLTQRRYTIRELAGITGYSQQTLRNGCPSLTTETQPFAGTRTQRVIITDEVLASFLRAKGFDVRLRVAPEPIDVVMPVPVVAQHLQATRIYPPTDMPQSDSIPASVEITVSDPPVELTASNSSVASHPLPEIVTPLQETRTRPSDALASIFTREDLEEIASSLNEYAAVLRRQSERCFQHADKVRGVASVTR